MYALAANFGIALMAVAIILSAFLTQLRGQEGGRPLRILIDASKDGGLWWFPQAGTFDPEQYHQGTRVAARLRRQGWAVNELGRDETITDSTLSGYDVIVIIQPFFSYRDSEQHAYLRAVEAGARLLLIGPGRSSGLHAAFGFRFSPSPQFGSAESWLNHPVNSRIEGLEVLWTPGFTVRRDAVALASIGGGNRKLPIVAYLPASNGGIGGVLYIGHSALLSDSSAVSDHLVESVDALGYGPINPDTSAIARRSPASQKFIPRLVLPISGQLLSQPADELWQFEWADVQGAVEYELVVSGPNSSVPLIRVVTTASEFRPKPPPVVREPNDKKPYIADHNLRGWTWRVRARGLNGQWGPWSKAGIFNVRPVVP